MWIGVIVGPGLSGQLVSAAASFAQGAIIGSTDLGVDSSSLVGNGVRLLCLRTETGR
jgi:hypothetical protein